MSEPIGPGDWVECVDGSPHLRSPRHSLLVGAVYQVHEVIPAEETADGHESVYLVGDTLPRSCCWRLRRFRPIYPGGGLIRKLLEKLPEAAPSGVAPASVERRSRDAIKEPVGFSDLRSQG